MNVKITNANQPSWKNVTVKSHIPAAFQPLDEIAHNLWFCWNQEALDLFRSLDAKIWEDVDQNPVELLNRISYKRLIELSEDKEVLARIKKVYKLFRDYMDEKPNAKRASVAYLCMEYGMNHNVKIYSGGLGVLAGDYVKEASDSNVDMCAVGFLYRYGYFSQTLSMDGQQIANYEAQDFDRMPIERVLDANGNQVVVDVPFSTFTVHALIWRVNVGRVPLYLLDTDNEMNSEFDRQITHALYGGDWENRMKQEYLLGIGGILALKKLGIEKDVYHCNEGHAALANLQRLADFVESGLNFDEALELVRASSLYTVHTPVPAGHDYFDEALCGKYLGQFPGRLGISWDDFMGLGRQNPNDKGERFCMSTFLCKTCQEVNGVSWLHGKVSQLMFQEIWPGYLPAESHRDHKILTHDEYAEVYNVNPEESHVGYVTNGVHYPSWCASEWKNLHKKYFGEGYIKDQSNQSLWENIYKVSDKEVWETRVALKKKLIDYIRERFRDNWLKNQGDPARVMSLLDKILIDEVERRGVTVRYGQNVTGYEEVEGASGEHLARLRIEAPEGAYTLQARFVLDASGYGRVLPRLLGLERPSVLSPRKAIFTHIDDRIVGDDFDRNKILISTHPAERGVWSWLIPFGNGRSSIGFIGEPEWINQRAAGLKAADEGALNEALLRGVVAEIPRLSRILRNAVWENGVPFSSISNYSANVTTLVGRNFALLGNAAEFLDPVFSSGVTVALQSARLASRVLGRQLRGEAVEWERDFVAPLKVGVEAFRTYVMGWYDGSFQDVVYCRPEQVNPEIRAMISSVLAGYAWDEANPFVARSAQRLKALAEICGLASRE